MPINTDPAEGSRPRSIILVEEYGALAVAIGSALKKFAPEHSRHVVPSLAAAREAAKTSSAELVIIDIDPPQSELVAFLEDLKERIPAAKLLAIGCGTSKKFEAARGAEAAIRFLEKPFELDDLGEAVQTLLSDDGDGPEAHRSLIDLGLADIVALLCVNGGRSVLTVLKSDGLSGELHFSGGQMVHASAGARVGEAALHEMFQWDSPRLAESQERGANLDRTITTPWDEALINALRQMPQPRVRTKASSPKRSRQQKVERPGKKIVVIDDTELLLVFVEEILSTAHPELRISTAHTGTEGVRRAELINPDLVLLDYSLPDINGAEVCRRLLEDERTALIPIVMMSGHVPEMSATAQRYANVVATISKPFLSHELISLVETMLDRGRNAVLEVAPAAEFVSPGPSSSESDVPHHGNGQSKPNRSDEPPASSAKTPTNVLPATSIALLAITEPERVEPEVAEEHPESRLVTPEPELRVAQSPPRTFEPSVVPRPFVPSPSALAVTLPKAMTVLVGLSLRTVAVQMNSLFQVERLRARPITATVSLNLPPDSSPLPAVLQTGFDLDLVTLNTEHQIATICLVPTRRALAPPPVNSMLTIAEVNPVNVSDGLELTSDTTSAMTVQLLSAFQIAAVELSAAFEVARLVLHSISPRARATLDGSNTAGSGVIFQTSKVHTDAAGHLAEIELKPL